MFFLKRNTSGSQSDGLRTVYLVTAGIPLPSWAKWGKTWNATPTHHAAPCHAVVPFCMRTISSVWLQECVHFPNSHLPPLPQFPWSWLLRKSWPISHHFTQLSLELQSPWCRQCFQTLCGQSPEGSLASSNLTIPTWLIENQYSPHQPSEKMETSHVCMI